MHCARRSLSAVNRFNQIKRLHGCALAAAILIIPASRAEAQQRCWSHWQATGAPIADFDHTTRLTAASQIASAGVTRFGKAMIENCSVLMDTTSGQQRVQWEVMPAALIAHSNSKYPRPQQDGLRWSGRGLSGSMMAAGAIRWGPLSAMIAPVVSYQKNEEYAILPVTSPELSPFGSFYHENGIDRPQRFGPADFWWVHPGQSFVRVDAYGVAAGFSTENMRWGPARRNPLLMSGTAPGFAHFFLGTSKPIDIHIAHVGAEAIWGRLQESDYFDNDAANDEQLFAGLVATFRPKHTGLTLGFTRAFLRTMPAEGLSLGEQIWGPYTGIRTNPMDPTNGDNQLFSVFMSWVLPESGFEVYGEYARDDHWEDWRDFIMELDHSRAYTVGVEKVFALRRSNHRLRIAGETTTLSMSGTYRSGRGGPSFYTHSQVAQGYTHMGQLLGAPIGPGSDAQHISADYFTPSLMGGLYVERIRYDSDAYYANFAYLFANRAHDAEWTIGVRAAGMVRNFEILGEIGYSARYNRDLVELRRTGEFTRDTNLGVTLGVAWQPRWGVSSSSN
jgi:hypothetical protein